jgi:hypothetical protein
MPRNNSKARKQWRKARLAYFESDAYKQADPAKKRSLAIFGNRDVVLFEGKPGTSAND